MALILNIDCSVTNASVSISRNGVVVNFLESNIQKNHSSFLHTAVEELLTSVSLFPNALDAIAVTSGPGSYTGLRVGYAAAKGLAFTLGKELISVGTLEVIANSAVRNNIKIKGLIAPMIDARRAEVFTAIYNSSGGELIPPHAHILNGQSFFEQLQEDVVYFCGDGASKFQPLIQHPNARFVTHGEIISSMSYLCYKKFLENDFEQLLTCVPLYVKGFYFY